MSGDHSDSEDFPNQVKLIEQLSGWITKSLNDPERKKFADEGIRRTLLASFDIDWETPLPKPPVLTGIEKSRAEIASLIFALFRIHNLIGQTQYYFRRYPFRSLPVSKSEHLANVCELYYDRIGRFRDRVKNLTKAMQQVKGVPDERYGRLIRWLNENFDGELRQRNYIQHHGRFEYPISEQLSLMELLGPRMRLPLPSLEQSIYMSETRKWSRKCVSVHKALNHVVEQCARLVLELGLWEEGEVSKA